MASFKKYQKNPTIVGVTTITADTAGDYGSLGTLTSLDCILYLASGTMVTMTQANLALEYSQTSDSAALVGTSWD